MADKSSFSTSVRNSAIIKNPVLFESIGVAPVVAMAVSVKTAIMLSVISAVELIVIECFTSVALQKIKHQYRVMIYAVLGVLINIPMLLLFGRIAPNETANVSIFLPIIAVNSLIALHCERAAVKCSLKEAFFDSVAASIGYTFIIFTVGIIRELLGSGTFYGISLGLPIRFSGLLLPFGGFLVLGFSAAFFKGKIKKKYPDENPEEAFNLSEISQSSYEDLKTLLEEDFEAFPSQAHMENPVDFFKGVVKREKKATSEKPDKKDKPERKKKPAKAKKTVENKTVAETPVEKKPREKYESEFDDILFELEKSKTAKSQTTQAEEDGEEQ